MVNGPPEKPRIAIDPESEYWLTLGEVAVLLETAEDDVMNLVERGGIPFYAVAGGNRSNPEHLPLRPRRDRRLGDRLAAFRGSTGWTYHRLEEILVGAALASAVTCIVLLMTIGGFLG